MFSQASVILSTVSFCPQEGGIHPPTGQTPPTETVTAADGARPAGMHSRTLLEFIAHYLNELVISIY